MARLRLEFALKKTPNAEPRTPNTESVAFGVGCWTFMPVRLGPFDVFFVSKIGRVAESGLRHSTRNRAWGNPPWVRIPPLPRKPKPVILSECEGSLTISLAGLTAIMLNNWRFFATLRMTTGRQDRQSAASYMKSVLHPFCSTAVS